MDISSFPCTQLVFAFSLGWTLKEVNINGDFNQYIWAFSLGWTQETDVRVTSSSLLISSGKPEEVFPTNIFSVLNECPPLSTEPKLFNTIPTQFLLSHFYPHWFSTEPKQELSIGQKYYNCNTLFLRSALVKLWSRTSAERVIIVRCTRQTSSNKRFIYTKRPISSSRSPASISITGISGMV